MLLGDESTIRFTDSDCDKKKFLLYFSIFFFFFSMVMADRQALGFAGY